MRAMTVTVTKLPSFLPAPREAFWLDLAPVLTRRDTMPYFTLPERD